MAYTLNTSHALYANLVELFGVQSGALVSHKTARTFTKHADATYGTGTYGEHFAALAGGYTAKGASFSPYLTLNTSTKPNYTVVAVVNSSGAVQGGTNSSFLSRTAGGDTIRSGGKDSSGNAYGYRVTGATMGTGARMITYCRIGETAAKLYNNTTLDASVTSLGADYNSPDARADFLCGWDGQNSMTASLVWLAVFDKELTLAEITDLYNSLGANNAFGLVQSAAGATLTSTSSLSAGSATLSGTASRNGATVTHSATAALSASAATLSGTSSRTGAAVTHDATATLTAGSATLSGTASHTAAGSFVSDIMVNNTGTAQTNVSIVWEWNKGVIGSAKTSTIYGTGTTSGTGTYTATGLPIGSGFFLATTADGSVYYQTGTVA